MWVLGCSLSSLSDVTRGMSSDVGTNLSVAALREIIEEAGLEHFDCIEKRELSVRAAEAQQLLAQGGPAVGRRSGPSLEATIALRRNVNNRPDLLGVEHPSHNDFARASEVVRVPRLFDDDDIAAVHALAASTRPHQINPAGKTNWQTTYLSADHEFAKALPALREKIFAAARAVDVDSEWHVLRGVQTLGARCIEYHRVGAQGGLPWVHHRE